MTFGLGNSAADERAVAASRGRVERMIELAIVSGMSGSWEVESGIGLLLSAEVPGLGPGLHGMGDGGILSWC